MWPTEDSKVSENLEHEIKELRERLNKVMRQRAALFQKSKQLVERVQDARHREHTQEDFARELLERQRELNFMLNRANIMLSRVHEANALLSLEFTEMVKALPEPQKKDLNGRISRMNDLFKRTGRAAEQEENLGSTESQTPPPPPNFSEAEIIGEAEPAPRKAKWWKSEHQPTEQPPNQTNVEPTPPEPSASKEEDVEPPLTEAEEVVISPNAEPCRPKVSDEDLAFPARRRSWWRFGG